MKRTLLALSLLAAACPAWANNIQVSNVSIVNQDEAANTVEIQFDISWENSWRLDSGPSNWDAAWVFAKFHPGDVIWRHAKLDPADGNHSVPAGVELDVGLTGGIGVGVFLYRDSAGSGDFNATGVRLLWDYGADGVLDTAIVSVDVQAVEMVYVPEGAFYLGDGATSGSYARGDDDTQPFLVTSADTIEEGNLPGELSIYNSAGASDFIYPSVFPNGYSAFYCMKYEPSQGQYAVFSNLTNFGISSYTRQQYTGSNPNRVATSPDRAYRQASSNQRLIDFLDWCGLRMMTEFEFEKACRGPVFPVPGEKAWGTASIATLSYALADDGTPTERVAANYDEDAGNCWWDWTAGSENGPCRVGMFAKSSYSGTTPARIQAGASYWGIMDLSGNVGEPVVSANRASLYTGGGDVSANPDYIEYQGSYYFYREERFRGGHGDGDVSSHPLDWADYPSFEAERGGSYFSPGSNASQLEVSDRSLVGLGSYHGLRGVRTAPAP